MTRPLIVRNLGQESYEPVWRRMQAFTDSRNDSTQDEIWLVEHPPVFTLGQAATLEHVLAPGEIPLVQVDRGGQVTYHGPGQAVIYPLWDLKRCAIGIKTLVQWLEQSVIDWLAQHQVEACRQDKAPGVYVAGQKIASMGLRVRRGCTFHGMAVNVKMDLEPFQRINPCGYQGLSMTQSSELGIPLGWQEAGLNLIRHLTAMSGHAITEQEAICA